MRKSLVFSGGSFHALQAYFDEIRWVVSTEAGYANGTSSHPSFASVQSGEGGFIQAVKVEYEDNFMSLETLIELYLRAIDPYSLDRQGEYRGRQYRCGIYYQDILDGIAITRKIDQTLMPYHHVDVRRLDNFFPAEEIHQHYKRKHPFWRCPIDFSVLKREERK